MPDNPKEEEPIEPLKSFITGLGLPGGLIIAAAAVGVLISIVTGNLGLASLTEAAKLGAYAGFFLSFLGVADIALGWLMGGGARFQNRLYTVAGYLVVWLGFYLVLRLTVWS